MAHYLLSGNVRRKGKSYQQGLSEIRVEATSLHAAIGKGSRECHKLFKGERLEKMTITAVRL